MSPLERLVASDMVDRAARTPPPTAAGGAVSRARRCPGPRAVLAVLAALVLGLAVDARGGHAQIDLPEMGDSSRSAISPQEEQALGGEFMRELRARVRLVEDPQVERYLRGLGYELASRAGQGSGFTFFVVQDPGINAFAAPGGYIGINSGLITTTETESELAAVMAHEIAHVTQHHLSRSIELRDKMRIPALAGLVAAILLGTQNPEAGQAAVAAVAGGATQMALNFSRAHEQEADRVGIQVLADAGFDPRAMADFFERMQQAARYYRQPPEFLSTHPVTVSRIADTRSRAEKYPYGQYTEDLTYHLVRAKLEVLQTDDPKGLVTRIEDRLERGQYRSAEATRYALALALLRTGETGRAREHVQALLEADPDRIPYVDALARIELAAGRVGQALEVYEDTLELYPGDEVLTRGYAEALLRAGRADRALAVIDRYQRHNAMDAGMYRLAAQAHERAGNRAASQLALAEHYYRIGRLDAAIHQLRLAKEASAGRDYYQASRIEARLQELERERAEREDR